MSLNPLTLLEKAINEHGSAVILKERLELVREQLDAIKNEKDALQKENTKLKKEVERLNKELESKTIPDDFIEHRGVLFRRNRDGKIDPIVYCRACKLPMQSFQKMMPYSCHCNRFKADFTGREISTIIHEIE